MKWLERLGRYRATGAVYDPDDEESTTVCNICDVHPE